MQDRQAAAARDRGVLLGAAIGRAAHAEPGTQAAANNSDGAGAAAMMGTGARYQFAYHRARRQVLVPRRRLNYSHEAGSLGPQARHPIDNCDGLPGFNIV
jgi:hypothetical protein